MKAIINKMDLQKELFFRKNDDEFTGRREELENELSKIFNESIAEGNLIEDEAQEILETLCESAIKAERVFNIIVGEEENNTPETEKEKAEEMKRLFEEAIENGNSLEAEVREMIEAIGLYSTDVAIMMNYIVDQDLGIDTAMKVLIATL